MAKDLSLEEWTPTQRDVAQTMSKIYDPVSFITPVTVRVKLFYQNLCKKKMGWDEILDGSSRMIWRRLLKDLKDTDKISVPRFLLWCCRSDDVNEFARVLWCIS